MTLLFAVLTIQTEPEYPCIGLSLQWVFRFRAHCGQVIPLVPRTRTVASHPNVPTVEVCRSARLPKVNCKSLIALPVTVEFTKTISAPSSATKPFAPFPVLITFA